MTAALVLAIALMLSGCGASNGAAEDVVGRWLTALTSTSGDRGWSLLHPDTRQSEYEGDEAQYIADATDADWTNFHWIIQDAVDEDGGTFSVIVRVSDPEEAPDFLIDHKLVQLVPGNQDITLGVNVVYGLGGQGVYRNPK